MTALVFASWLLVPLSLAVQVPQSVPGRAGSVATGAASREGWEFCVVPQTASASEATSQIPHILHQTYKTADLPPVYHRNHESWLQQAPSWEHRVWTDLDNRALIATSYPWFLSTYDSYPYPIERSDAARYFILHRYGGVYADLDIEAFRDPAPLISGGHQLMLFYDWGNTPEIMLDPHPWDSLAPSITNALMASAPGHPFWMYVAKRMQVSKLDSDVWVSSNPSLPDLERFEKIFWATGPWFLSITANDYMKEDPQAHAGITEPKYWSPIPPGNLELMKAFEEKAACMKRFPDAVLFHHSVGEWIFPNKTDPEKLSKKKGGCNRADWSKDL